MRYKLKDSTTFFDKLVSDKFISLKQLSKVISVNYSTLKKYRRGEWTIPAEIFEKLLLYTKRKLYWKNNLKVLDNNWGGVKGGTNSALKDINYKRLAKARTKRKIPNVILKLDKFFSEFYGALLGDGCISKYVDYENKERYVIMFSGNKKLDSNYFKYLKNEIEKRYKIHVYYYEYKDKNVCVLSIKNKGLCICLNSQYSVPIGLKYGHLKISNKILNLPWDVKKYVLRGLFDTDGCILANKRENYRYPWIIITSKDKRFRNQLIKILREKNYPAYNTGLDVCVRGIANVKRWFEDIGSSNSRNIIKYEYFLKYHCLPARLL